MTTTALTAQDILAYPELLPPEMARDLLDTLDPVSWTLRHLTTEKGEKLDYTVRPYMPEYIRDFHPHIAAKKAAQLGFTTASVEKLIWFGDQNAVTGIYTFPSATDVEEFSKLRFKQMIINSPYLMSRMTGVDSARSKQIGDSTFYFRGTMTERQAISVPADILVHDELDFSAPDVKETYSPRLSASKYKYIWEFSTPTIPNYGIDAIFRLSDKKFWFLKCTRCNTWQTVDYFRNTMPRKKKRGYYYGCKKCGKVLNRMKGEWITKYPNRTKDGRGIRGYFIPQTIAPFISADYLVSEHEKAKRGIKGEKVFYNFNLGLPFETGDTVLTREILKGRLMDEMPVFSRIYMGVDQGDILHIEIGGVSVDGRRCIFHVESTDRFGRIEELIEQYDVSTCVIDGLPNKHSAKQVRDKYPGRVYLAYYTDAAQGLWNPRNPEKEPYSIVINNLDALDNTAAEWVSGKAGLIRSNLTTPLIETWIDHMLGMKRAEIEDKRGQNVPRWLKVAADHYRHADLYHYIAVKVGAFGSGEDFEVGGNSISVSTDFGVFGTLFQPSDFKEVSGVGF